MSRPPLHPLTSRFGANGRRMITVPMVVAVGMLLAVPATAGAHVAKKHHAEFKRGLECYGRVMMLQKDGFDRAQIDVDGVADQIGPLLGSQDPVDKANLAGLQILQAQFANSWAITVPRTKASNDKAIEDFYKKSLPWLRIEADKRDLRYGTNGIKKGLDQLFDAGFGGLAPEEQTLAEAVKLDDLVEYYAQYEAAGQGRHAAAKRFNRATGVLNDLH